MKITEPFTFAAVGDIIIRRPVGQLDDAGFQALTKVMRAADATYANMEGPIIDESDPNYHGPPAGGPKTIIADLKAMGVRVMTTANNHTMDGGSEGMFMTNRLLDEAKITHAGSGRDLTEARRARSGLPPKGRSAWSACTLLTQAPTLGGHGTPTRGINGLASILCM